MANKISKGYKTRSFQSKLFREEKNWVSCAIYVIYNPNNGNIYVSPSFSWGTKSARLGYLGLTISSKPYVNGSKLVTDKELRNKVEELVKQKPTASCNEIAKITKISRYRINRMYMSIKRKIL